MNQAQYRSTKKTNIWMFALITGSFAGVIWGAMRGFFYFLRFTSIVPGFLAEPFYKKSFLESQPGYYIGWLFFLLFSIGASLIYTLIFRKLKGPWPGLIYGILWWGVLFWIIGPMYLSMKRLSELSWNTIISEFCLFLLWGVFIGYTVAMEFTDERAREPKKAKK